MSNRVTDHNDPSMQHAAYCRGCESFHGPLYICDCYDGEDIDEVNKRRVAYAESPTNIIKLLFPPVPPVQNYRNQ